MHARWFAGAALLSILPLMHGACGQGETIEVQGINVPCEDDCDCYTGQNYFLGRVVTTEFVNARLNSRKCICFPAAKKGGRNTIAGVNAGRSRNVILKRLIRSICRLERFGRRWKAMLERRRMLRVRRAQRPQVHLRRVGMLWSRSA